MPGTTRDAVDTHVLHDGKSYRFIDTAGIRRKGKTNLLAEKLSVIMARKHLERADVALLVADASAGISAGDATIAGYAHESGRSVIVVMNKWDLAIEKARSAPEASETKKNWKRGGARAAPRAARRRAADEQPIPRSLPSDYEPLVRERLKFLSYAPVIFLSALTGERVEKLYALIDRVAAARRRRISTGELNRWLANVDLDRGTSPTAHRVKIYYVTQASASPPTFIFSPISGSGCTSASSAFWRIGCAKISILPARRSASSSACGSAATARRAGACDRKRKPSRGLTRLGIGIG